MEDELELVQALVTPVRIVPNPAKTPAPIAKVPRVRKPSKPRKEE